MGSEGPWRRAWFPVAVTRAAGLSRPRRSQVSFQPADPRYARSTRAQAGEDRDPIRPRAGDPQIFSDVVARGRGPEDVVLERQRDLDLERLRIDADRAQRDRAEMMRVDLREDRLGRRHG